MAEALTWILISISVIFAFIGGHILLTKVLPPLKKILSSVLKDENAVNSLMAILLVFVAVLVLQKSVELLMTLENQVINVVTVINPALEIILSFGTYIGYLILGIMIVIGLKNWK